MKWHQPTVIYSWPKELIAWIGKERRYWYAKLPPSAWWWSRVKLLFQRGCLAWCIHKMMWSDKLVSASILLYWWRRSSCSSAETALICWAQNNPVGESCCAFIHSTCLRHVCPRHHFGRENPSHSGWNPVWSETSWARIGKEEQSRS